MTRILVIAAAAALASLQASAQAPPPAPASTDLPLAVSTEWAQATIAACTASGYAVTATYMNADYSIGLVLRADGARAMTVDVGRRKAYTVLKTGKTSGEFGASVALPAGTAPAAPVPGALPGLPPGQNVDQNLIIWAGGLPVKVGGKVVGAVSVSGAPGGDKDEACAQAGLAKIAGKLAAH
jgi:uncharacterized protein GlcG (DUF336 family)